MMLNAAVCALCFAGALSGANAQTATSPATRPATQPAPVTRPAAKDAVYDRIAEFVANEMDKQHGGAALRLKSIVQCDVKLTCGENTFNGRLSLAVNTRAARLDNETGEPLIVTQSDRIWASPESGLTTTEAQVRLDTWRMLFTAPFAAREPGSRITTFRALTVTGGDADAFLLSFAPPRKTQAFVYAEARSHRLRAVADENLAPALGIAQPDPQPKAVVYSDIQEVEGILIPSTWTFFDWTSAAGVRGSALGTVNIANIRFRTQDDFSIELPAGEVSTTRPSPSGPPTTTPSR